MHRALYDQLHDQATRHPAAFQRRLRRFLFVGYVMRYLSLMGMLVLLLVLAILSPWMPLAEAALLVVGVVTVIWMLCQIRSPDSPPAQGATLEPPDAPGLFQLIDEVRRQWGGPPVHRVVVTEKVEAGAARRPNQTLHFLHDDELVLGLPLLLILSRDQLEPLIAHCLLQLACGDVKREERVRRMRLRWQQVSEAHETVHPGEIFPPMQWWVRFGRRYLRQLHAYDAAMRRAQDLRAHTYVADRGCPATIGSAIAVSSAISIHLQDRFWPALWRTAIDDSQPPVDVGERLIAELRSGLSHDQARKLRQCLLQYSDVFCDPVLSPRSFLRVLGVEAIVTDATTWPQRLAAPRPAAADELLGERLETLATRFSDTWAQANAQKWRQHHQQLLACRRTLHDWEKAPSLQVAAEPDWPRHVKAELGVAAPRAQRLHEVALARTELYGNEAAIDLFKQAIAIDPDDARSHRALGVVLAARGEEAAVAHLERAIKLEPLWTAELAWVLCRYWQHAGDPAQSNASAERALAQEAALQPVFNERRVLHPDTPFDHHALSPEAVALVRSALARMPEVERAFLLRQVVRHRPDLPALVLLVQCGDHTTPTSLGDRFLQLSGSFRVATAEVTAEAPPWRKRLASLPNALIHERMS